jgi:hypothetical protein
MKVTLGKKYKDSISGYEGIAIARAIYLYGCVRVLISPTKLRDEGDFLPDTWFDEPQLQSVRSKKVLKKKPPKPTGGPPRSVPSHRDPPNNR